MTQTIQPISTLAGQLTPANPAAILNRRSLAGLLLVGLLVLCNQLIVQPALLGSMTDAPLINVAGRQRMYSQRLAKEALALKAARTPAERTRWQQSLEATSMSWSANHLSLREEELRHGGGKSSDAAKTFETIEPYYRQIRDAAFRLGLDDDATEGINVGIILDAEPNFLAGMEQIVGMYEARAQRHINRLITMGWFLTALILVGLVAIGWLVLRPSANLIERQFRALRSARDALEQRVEERTVALARANADLTRAAEERARADQRQRALVEQFSHVARTSTIGEMASGLAHEINQPLGAIANYTEGCLVALGSPAPLIPEIRAILEKILATTLRAGAIVQRIRRFVTRQETVRERVSAAQLLEDTKEFFREEAERRGVQLQVDLAPNVPYVLGDPVQIQQVLVNLVRNAFDAVFSAQPQSPTIVLAAKEAGEQALELTVSDNGEGISPDQIPRIFDAYFSTRDAGMGMGLAISRTIAEAHEGSIWAESAPGQGATFRVVLPAASNGDDGGSDRLHR
jgi:two-component system sensor kinase FixL